MATPLQSSCLQNPMDWGAWWAAVHRVARIGHDWACARTHTHTHTHTGSRLPGCFSSVLGAKGRVTVAHAWALLNLLCPPFWGILKSQNACKPGLIGTLCHEPPRALPPQCQIKTKTGVVPDTAVPTHFPMASPSTTHDKSLDASPRKTRNHPAGWVKPSRPHVAGEGAGGDDGRV